MRFDRFSLFLFGSLTLAGAVSGLAVDCIHPHFTSWNYGEADRLYYEDMGSDYFSQSWDIQWGQGLTPQNLGTLYINWQGTDGNESYVHTYWAGHYEPDTYQGTIGGHCTHGIAAQSGHGLMTPMYMNAQGTVINTQYMFQISVPFTWNKVDTDMYPPLGPALGRTAETLNPGFCMVTIVGYQPPWKYDCFFAVQGVAFFDGQTNHSVSFTLKLNDVTHSISTVSASGAYYNKSSLVHLDQQGDLLKEVKKYYWVVTSPLIAGGSYSTPEQWTSADMPDEYVYVLNLDWTDWNTNTPPLPPDPTNTPPNPPDNPTNNPPNPYPDLPPAWNTNIYGPYPPYYAPWPPPYPAPPPLPAWPQYPPPNWPYNTNGPTPPNPGPPDPTPGPVTNYPDPGPSSNGTYTLDQWYSMFRRALKDEGDSYIPSDPAQYGVIGSNDLIAKAQAAGDAFFAAGDGVRSNTGALLSKGAGIAGVIAGTLQSSLPLSLGQRTELSFGTFPYLDLPVKITVSDWPVIGIFRSLCKWCMYLGCFWMSFRMIRRALGRVE